MFCNKCGTKLEANAKVCHGCNSIINNEGNNQLLNSANNQVIPSNHVNQDVMPIDASLNKKLDTTEVNNKSKIKKVIIVILIVIMFLVSIFFGYKFVKKYLADLKESVTYDINYKNYTLTILNRYLYDSSNYNNDFLTFSDDPSNYVVSLNIASGNYQNLENNYLKLKPI